MISAKNEKICNASLISKFKGQTETKKLKKIIKYLRNLSEEDVKKSSELKIKIFKEEKEKEKQREFKIIAPIIGFHHYSEDFNNSISKQVKNKDNNYEGDTPSTVDGNEEELNQIDSSDFSDDE